MSSFKLLKAFIAAVALTPVLTRAIPTALNSIPKHAAYIGVDEKLGHADAFSRNGTHLGRFAAPHVSMATSDANFANIGGGCTSLTVTGLQSCETLTMLPRPFQPPVLTALDSVWLR